MSNNIQKIYYYWPLILSTEGYGGKGEMRLWILFIVFLITAGCTGEGPVESPEAVDEPPVATPPEEEEAELLPVFMPGTQPEDGITLETIEKCGICHEGYNKGEGAYDDWRGSMMANALRDPLFWALLATQNKVFEEKGIGIGDYCLRCHSPKGWVEGRSEPADGSAFEGEDYYGVQCDVCHRMVDPLSEEGKALVSDPVETHRNGQYVISPDIGMKRGPYDDSNSPQHNTSYSEFMMSSEFCGTCHEILNPYYNNEVVVEKTYTEWKYSSYAGEDGKTCQNCHEPLTEGYGCTTNFARNQLFRDNIPLHQFIGGNAWVPLAIIEFEETLGEELPFDFKEQLTNTRKLAIEQLGSAAELESTRNGDVLDVKVTNVAGHKLPTGFTEGRRMWINVRFYDASGEIIKESGAYDSETAELTLDSEVKVYEAKPGLKGIEGFPDGPSFHFALNNHMYKDNRIPPEGFTNTEFEANGAYIIGATYEDGQHWDITPYDIPAEASKVEVALKYQTSSKEFIEFLRDENVDNKFDVKNAGATIYEIWEKTGKSEPVVMAEVSLDL
jgi:hypothetical protein